MKKIKTEWLLLAIAFLFLGFTGGLAVGERLTEDGLRITTANAPVAQTAELVGNDRATEAVTAEPSAAPTAPAETEPPTASDARVNINTASADALMTLPGIGEVLAQRIIDYRTANGAFSAVSELTQVNGIGEKRLDAILDYITVEDQP